MCTIVTKNVGNILKKMLIGRIKVLYYEGYDTLEVIIIAHGITYNYELRNISVLIHQGISSKTIANKIVTGYKKYLNNLFFDTARHN